MPQAILINHSTTENLQPHENKTGPKEMPYECHKKGQIQRNGKRSDQGEEDELHSLNKRYWSGDQELHSQKKELGKRYLPVDGIGCIDIYQNIELAL